MDFILSPLAVYPVLGLSVVMFFALFLSVSFDFRRRDREHAETVASLKAEMAGLREQLQILSDRPAPIADAAVEPAGAAMTGAAMTGPAMNLTKRAQALRLHRLGTDVAEIARRLGVAQGEVRLAIKMHQILIEQTSAV